MKFVVAIQQYYEVSTNRSNDLAKDAIVAEDKVSINTLKSVQLSEDFTVRQVSIYVNSQR